jgi:hypothetical protein
MQKWEYAHISYYTEYPGQMTLTYLHPSGEKRLTFDKASKTAFRQLCQWVTTLGQEGYEMTGVTAPGDAAGRSTYGTYWFKRPLT